MHRNQVETDLDRPSEERLAYKWKALIITALGTSMGTMDASITNISFPILTRVFDIQLTTRFSSRPVFYPSLCCSVLLHGTATKHK